MSEETSEQKSLPPSERKLRKARKKGQIAKSQDIVAAASMIILTVYLVLAWPSILGQFARMFDAAGRAARLKDGAGWNGAVAETTDAIGAIIVPLYFLSVIAIVLGAIISNKGVIFSFHPIKPDIKRIHPVQGFKRIFSVRNFVEFSKALVKSCILIGALAFAAWYGIAAVMRIPYCGAACVDDALIAVAAPLVIIALLLFFFAALTDANVQKWLFTREMRMTHTEFKRELKEIYGDPQIRGARNRLRREAASGEDGPARQHLKSRVPTLVVCSGNQIAVALRYMPGETPAPIVVGKGTGRRAAQLIEAALNARIQVENDSDLAEDLLRRTKMDSYIPDSMFRPIARVINRRERAG